MDPARRQRLTRRVGLACLIVLVLVAALFVGRRYVDAQWYVGVANGHVAVFQGIPASPLGFDLSHAVEETSLPAAEVEHLPLYEHLADGINANSHDEAEQIVQKMTADLQSVQQQNVPAP